MSGYTPSGAISMASINTALNYGSASRISLNDSMVRRLQVATSGISCGTPTPGSSIMSMNSLKNKPGPDSYGTYESQSCSGYTLNVLASTGDYGTYTSQSTPNSPTCGYVAYTSTLYTFASSQTVTVPTGMNAMYVVIVAGGGGGGQSDPSHGFLDGGGGGGAGGVAISPKIYITPGSSVSMTVGSGGTGGGGSGLGGQGANGTDTSITINGTTYTVYGGGGGGGSVGGTGQHLQPGKSGGSGGGSNGTNVVIDGAIPGRVNVQGFYFVTGGSSTKGNAPGWTVLGNTGGTSMDNGLNGGGGGAGGVGNPGGFNLVPYGGGGNVPMQANPTGGPGINPQSYGFPVSIPGTYVGGGGGAGGSGIPNINDDPGSTLTQYGIYVNNVNTANYLGGGQGGGGNGGIGINGISGTAYAYPGNPGSPNTGGGGGGAGGGLYYYGQGGKGGSGVIYIYGMPS